MHHEGPEVSCYFGRLVFRIPHIDEGGCEYHGHADKEDYRRRHRIECCLKVSEGLILLHAKAYLEIEPDKIELLSHNSRNHKLDSQ